MIKKKPTKKHAKKKAVKKASSIHKDTKSHNVRVSVVSGVSTLDKIIAKGKEQFFSNWEDIYNRKGLYEVKLYIAKTAKEKNEIKKHIKNLNKLLTDYKKLAKKYYNK